MLLGWFYHPCWFLISIITNNSQTTEVSPLVGLNFIIIVNYPTLKLGSFIFPEVLWKPCREDKFIKPSHIQDLHLMLNEVRWVWVHWCAINKKTVTYRFLMLIIKEHAALFLKKQSLILSTVCLLILYRIAHEHFQPRNASLVGNLETIAPASFIRSWLLIR